MLKLHNNNLNIKFTNHKYTYSINLKNLWCIHTMGYYLEIKKEQSFDICNSLDESSEMCTEWKNQIPKDYLLYDSIYVIFLK